MHTVGEAEAATSFNISNGADEPVSWRVAQDYPHLETDELVRHIE